MFDFVLSSFLRRGGPYGVPFFLAVYWSPVHEDKGAEAVTESFVLPVNTGNSIPGDNFSEAAQLYSSV